MITRIDRTVTNSEIIRTRNCENQKHFALISIIFLSIFNYSVFSYVQQYIASHDLPASIWFRKWIPTNEHEMGWFIVLSVSIGLTHQEDLGDYWSHDEVLHIPFYWKIMSCDKFFNILSSFHLLNNADYIAQSQPGHDPLFKLGKV